MSRFLLVAAVSCGLFMTAGPLVAAKKVQVETHRSKTPVDAKTKRTKTTSNVVGVSFGAHAEIAADGSIQYDCVETHGSDERERKSHFHEVQ